MGDEHLHWSERAKMAHPDGYAPVALPESRPPRASRRGLVAGGIVLLVVAAAAVVMLVYPPWERSEVKSPSAAVTTPSAQEATTGTSASAAGNDPSPSTSQTWAAIEATMALHTDPVSGFTFEYPASWVEFPPEGLMGTETPVPGSIGLGDPYAGVFGSTPINCVTFAGHVETQEEAAVAAGQPEPTSAEALEEASAYWMANTAADLSVEAMGPVRAFSVNGLDAAETTFRMTAQGHPLRVRICFASSGPYSCVLFMWMEEDRLNEYRPVFDHLVDSLRVGTLL